MDADWLVDSNSTEDECSEDPKENVSVEDVEDQLDVEGDAQDLSLEETNNDNDVFLNAAVRELKGNLAIYKITAFQP